MLKVNGNAIELTRGDTARFTITVKNELTGNDYEIQPNDVIVMTIKKKEMDADALVVKEITGTNLIHLRPEDTSELSFGKYVYDIQLTTEGGDVYTIIPPSTFELAKEVTY